MKRDQKNNHEQLKAITQEDENSMKEIEALNDKVEQLKWEWKWVYNYIFEVEEWRMIETESFTGKMSMLKKKSEQKCLEEWIYIDPKCRWVLGVLWRDLNRIGYKKLIISVK